MLLLLACTAPDSGKLDSGDTADTDTATTDTVDTADTSTTDTGDTDTDTGETDTATTETGDTAPETGTLDAAVTFGGASLPISCGPASPNVFTHTFVDAMGNTSGDVSCTDSTGARLRIYFTAGGTGAWTEPDGLDFAWTSAAGETLQWGAAGTETVGWAMQVDTFTRTSAQTIDFAGAFAGTWVTSEGAIVGSVDGTFALTLTCDAC